MNASHRSKEESLGNQPNTSASMTNASVARGDFLTDVSGMMWCVVPPVLLVFGSLGNAMIVVVMRGMRVSQSTAGLSVYFTALAVSDQCLLLASVLWFGVDELFAWPPTLLTHPDFLCALPELVFYACSLTSAWFLVALTYQRVTSVVAPHRVAVLCTVRRGQVITAVIVVTAWALNSHVLFTFAYQPEQRECVPRERYEGFVFVFTWLDLLWASAFPFLLLIVGNSVLVVHVIRSIAFSRRHLQGSVAHHQKTASANKVYPMTVTLILTSAAFLVLTLPICIVHAYTRALRSQAHDNPSDDSDNDFSHAALNLARTVALLIWCTASASNFYIYLLSGRKFREETKRHLCWRRTGVRSESRRDMAPKSTFHTVH